ncbi:MAG: hypothetical protein HWN66_04995 [Candidatus Helarchaeota archaeon]|nr:hypothetical protein [Candidatus Helarchaeota archaeon]
MNPATGTSGETESNLMQVLTGILEDSVQTLKRIEKAVNDSTQITTQMLEKLDLMDKKIESGFIAVVKKALPSLEHKFMEKISNVGGEMGDLTMILPDIITKLQQSMQILSIQSLIKELDSIPGAKKKMKSPEKEAPKEKVKKGKKKEPSPTAPPPPISEKGKAPPPKKEDTDEGDHLLKPSSFFGS